VEKQSNRDRETLEQIITFKVAKENYGVEIQMVKEVLRQREITRLPKAPAFVKGVINLRGDVIPVIDLREKFGFEEEEYTDKTRVIVVEVDQKSIGMIVDSVSHVVRLAESQIEPPPALVGGVSSEFIRGVGKFDDRLVVLLNINKILTMDEKMELRKMEEPAAA
jgi:purine-binding chemotaxis protein CheW